MNESCTPPPRLLSQACKACAASRFLAIGILASAAALSYWLSYWSDISPPPNAGLVVDDASLNFGEVWENENFVWPINIANTSAKEITIDHFEQSCTCVSTVPKSVTIPAGGNATVKIRLDLTTSNQQHLQLQKRDFSIQIVPAIKDSTLQLDGWVVQGRVKSPFLIEQSAITYSKALVRGETFPVSTVKARAHLPIEGLEVKCTPPLAFVRVVKEGQDFRIDLTPKADWRAGHFSAEVIVSALTNEGKLPTARWLSFSGEICEQVVLDTAMISFGPRALGQKVEATVCLRALRGQRFTVENIEGISKTLQVERVSPENQEFKVIQDIDQLGHHQVSLKFHVCTLSTHERFALEAKVTYHGIPETLSRPKTGE